MKVGDLVRCVWQPKGSGVRDGSVMPMKYHIKGELGIIVRQQAHYNVILFPKFGYEHDLSPTALEVISESR